MTAEHVDRLLALVGPDGVIGLGEPTHGSANAFTWKLDVVIELTARGLLGAVALEDSAVVGLAVDRALRDRGDVAVAWRDASSIWRTRAILDGLTRWQAVVRTVPAPARPRFLGIDVKRPDLAAGVLLDAGLRGEGLELLRQRAELGETWIDEVQRVCESVPPNAAQPVLIAARQLLRHIDIYLREPDLQGLHRRDAHMAQTLIEGLPSRGLTVLWAHNEHVARNPDNFGGPSTGHVLRERLGKRYAAVGILCGEGTCRAVDPSAGDDGYRAVALPRARPGTTEVALAATGETFVTSAAFAHPGPRRFIGWKVDSSLSGQAARATFELNRPSTDFDALVHLPESVADEGV